MSSDGPAKREEIESSTAARLAEIVAAAERAAKQVIDEAEDEARTRLADAHEEADRIVAERLAGLARLTDEIGSQAEELRRRAEELQLALVQAKLEIGGPDALGGSATIARREAEPTSQRPTSPSLTVVGGEAAEEPSTPEPVAQEVPAPAEEPDPAPDLDPELPADISRPQAGARLLATQMAVSGSSRAEIEARLRDGFAITDTRPILDAILGPES